MRNIFGKETCALTVLAFIFQCDEMKKCRVSESVGRITDTGYTFTRFDCTMCSRLRLMRIMQFATRLPWQPSLSLSPE